MSLYKGTKLISSGGLTSSMLINPFSLLEPKHSELAIINPSWVESTGQWLSKEQYPSAYNRVLEIGKRYDGQDYWGWIDGSTVYYTTSFSAGDPVYRKNSDDTFSPLSGVTIKSYAFTDQRRIILSNNRSMTNKDYLDYGLTTALKYDFLYKPDEETFRLPLSTRHSFVIKEGVELGNQYRIWNDGFCEQWGSVTNTSGVVSGARIYFPIQFTGDGTSTQENEIMVSVTRVAHTGDSSSTSNATRNWAAARTGQISNISVAGFNIDIMDGSTSNEWVYHWKAWGRVSKLHYTPYHLYYYMGDVASPISIINPD